MKIKKAIKIVIIFFLCLLVLWLFVFINSHIRLKQDRTFLTENGYANLVSTGDHSVNVLSCGNENGKHRIVAIAGFGDPDPCLSWGRMTAVLEEDHQVIFVDRAGYGLSDNTSQERTVENIVEDYRTALRNACAKAPYILLPHSIGGIYAPDQMRTKPDPSWISTAHIWMRCGSGIRSFQMSCNVCILTL